MTKSNLSHYNHCFDNKKIRNWSIQHPFFVGPTGVFEKPVTRRRAKIDRWCDSDNAKTNGWLQSNYCLELNKYHKHMASHATCVGTSHWKRCWSSLWVYSFLLNQMAKNSSISKPISQVPVPCFVATIDAKLIDQELMKLHYKDHCERVSQYLVTCSKQMDQWSNFCEKVKLSVKLISYLRNEKVFPTKTVEEMNRAIGLMSPVLSRLSRDDLRGQIGTLCMSGEVQIAVKKINPNNNTSIQEYNKLVSDLKMKYAKSNAIVFKTNRNSKHPLSSSLATTKSKKRQKVKPKLRDKHLSECQKNRDQVLLSNLKSEMSHTKTKTDNTTTDGTTGEMLHKDTKIHRSNHSLILSNIEMSDNKDISSQLPIIVVETYRDKISNQIVRGPAGKHGNPSCFSDNRKDRLSMVLGCPSTNACTHCFSMAHKRPHFVIPEKSVQKYFSEAMAASSGMPKIVFHSKHCLSSPITTNDDDGSLNFYFYSNRTKEFQEIFDSFQINF